MVNRLMSEAMADILQACCLTRGKTSIICKVKLIFTQADEYLTQVAWVGLLSKAKRKYEIMAKGREFMVAYNRLGEIIGVHNLSLMGMKVLTPLSRGESKF